MSADELEDNGPGHRKVLLVDDEEQHAAGLHPGAAPAVRPGGGPGRGGGAGPAGGRPLAVIVSDQRMPGMDGVELLGRVKDVSRTPPGSCSPATPTRPRPWRP